MFKNYMKTAIRNLLRYKVYSFINIFGLSIGLTAVLLILLFVHHELNFNRFHEKGNRVYRIMKTGLGSSRISPSMPAPLAPTMKNEFPEIEQITRLSFKSSVHITANEKHFFENGFVFTDPSAIEIFSFNFLEGNPRTALNDPFSILLSKSMAMKYFGSENPMGKTIIYKRSLTFKVTGIFQDLPDVSSISYHFIVPFTTLEKISRFYDMNNWGAFSYHTYLLLKQDTDVKKLENKMPGMIEKHLGKEIANQVHLTFQPLFRIHFDTRKSIILLFTGIAFLILLIACINYINLTTARSSQRINEIGIRKVAGANRSQLIRQFLSESMIFTILAFLIAGILVSLFLPSFSSFVKKDLITHLNKSGNFFLWIFALLVFVSLFAGLYPSFAISSKNLAYTIHGTITGSKKSTLRSILVIFQFTVSILLIITTLVIKGQLRYITTKEIGFQKKNVIVVDSRDKRLQKNFETIQHELKNNPSIRSVTASYYLPNFTDCATTIEWPGMSEDREELIYLNYVDYDFIDLYGIKIIRGRNFSRDLLTDANGAFILNEAAVKMLGWKSAVGRELTHHMGRQKGTIVGIVKDFHMNPLREPIEPLCIELNPQKANMYLSVLVDNNHTSKTLNYIRKKINQFAPDYPFNYHYFEDIFQESYNFEQKLELIFSLFSLVAIIIACIGLFGLSSFLAEQRTKEIGIRKVLGSSASGIILLLSKEFTKWVIISNVISWPIAYLMMNKFLQVYTYRINIGLSVFIFSGLVALGIAVLTISCQSLKAARANPVESLRYE